jgi:tetratricopeptide (TPR) repeat protein
MKQLFVLGAVLSLGLFAADAHAQMGAVRGKVLDDTGAPAVEAQVRLLFKGQLNKDVTIKTNKKGEYMQVGLPPGSYEVTVTKDGFAPMTFTASVGAGGPTDMRDVNLVKGGAAAAGAAGKAVSSTGALRTAVTAAREGRHDEAEAAVQKVIAADPGDAQAHSILGYIYVQKKDWASAEKAYLKAKELDPSNTDTILGLTETYQKQGNIEKATEILTAATQANPQDGQLQFSLALHYMNTQRQPEAAEALKKAQAATPDNAEIYYYQATLAIQQNDAPGAVGLLEKYLSMSPSNTQNVATAQGLLTALKPKK